MTITVRILVEGGPDDGAAAVLYGQKHASPSTIEHIPAGSFRQFCLYDERQLVITHFAPPKSAP